MSPERPPYHPGEFVGSKYRLVKVLGEGGMSVIYDAVDTTCERKVAVKVIRPSQAGKGVFSMDRMQREAAVLVQLHERTEFVVDVLTSGITDDDRNLPYYVMERLRGDTLRQFMCDQLVRDVDFAIDEIAGVGVPIAVALAHAHALGVVHRDTKPENIFMAATHDGRAVIKVLDFGICARADDQHAPAWFAGTLAYAAPEQLEGRPPVPATDVYALGLILFEMATLKLPHGRHRDDLTLERLAMAILKKPVPDLATLRLDTPPEFADLVSRCLAFEPDRRPSAADVARALRDIRLTFLGEQADAKTSETAATDVRCLPIAILQGPLAAAGMRPQQVPVAGGTPPVDLFAADASEVLPAKGPAEDVGFFRRPSNVRTRLHASRLGASRVDTLPGHETPVAVSAPITPDRIVTLQSSMGLSERPIQPNEGIARSGRVEGARVDARALPLVKVETAPAHESPPQSERGRVGPPRRSTVPRAVLALGTAAFTVALFVTRSSPAPRSPATTLPALPAGIASPVSQPSLASARDEPPIGTPPPASRLHPASQEETPRVSGRAATAPEHQLSAGAPIPPAASSPQAGSPPPARVMKDRSPLAAAPGGRVASDDPFVREFRTVLNDPPAAPSPPRATAPAPSRSATSSSAAFPDDFKMIY